MCISNASTILFATVLVLGGCSKKNDDTPAPSGGGGTGGSGALTANTVPFMQMTIDGTTVSYTEGATYGSFPDNYENIATPPASSSKTYSYIMYRKPDMDDVVCGAGFGRFNYQGSAPTDAQFFGFFTTGSKPYGDFETDNGRVAIAWLDADGNEWSTFWGEDHSGASFNITEVLVLFSTTGTSSILVRATFNCKLYLDDESGQFKQVSNGTGVFQLYNS